jgi:putative endonuclease
MKYFTYILTIKNNLIFYVGITYNLNKRIFEHKNKVQKAFTNTYNVNKLVYFEEHTCRCTFKRKEIKKMEKRMEVKFN